MKPMRDILVIDDEFDVGEMISVSNTIENIGTEAAGSFRVGIYLSSDANITTGDTLIGANYRVNMVTCGPYNVINCFYLGLPSDHVSLEFIATENPIGRHSDVRKRDQRHTPGNRSLRCSHAHYGVHGR